MYRRNPPFHQFLSNPLQVGCSGLVSEHKHPDTGHRNSGPVASQTICCFSVCHSVSMPAVKHKPNYPEIKILKYYFKKVVMYITEHGEVICEAIKRLTDWVEYFVENPFFLFPVLKLAIITCYPPWCWPSLPFSASLPVKQTTRKTCHCPQCQPQPPTCFHPQPCWCYNHKQTYNFTEVTCQRDQDFTHK